MPQWGRIKTGDSSELPKRKSSVPHRGGARIDLTNGRVKLGENE